MCASRPSELTGKLLIAMRSIGDARFDNAVIYLCAHSSEGAMGLIINHETQDVDTEEVYRQLNIPILHPFDMPVHVGGPVDAGRGFVLHNADYKRDATTLVVDHKFAMTASQTIMADIASSSGPRQRLLCLGYSGWAARKLEAEMERNIWLVADADPDLVFNCPSSKKWEAALHSIGINPAMLAFEGGRA